MFELLELLFQHSTNLFRVKFSLVKDFDLQPHFFLAAAAALAFSAPSLSLCKTVSAGQFAKGGAGVRTDRTSRSSAAFPDLRVHFELPSLSSLTARVRLSHQARENTTKWGRASTCGGEINGQALVFLRLSAALLRNRKSREHERNW